MKLRTLGTWNEKHQYSAKLYHINWLQKIQQWIWHTSPATKESCLLINGGKIGHKPFIVWVISRSAVPAAYTATAAVLMTGDR